MSLGYWYDQLLRYEREPENSGEGNCVYKITVITRVYIIGNEISNGSEQTINVIHHEHIIIGAIILKTNSINDGFVVILFSEWWVCEYVDDKFTIKQQPISRVIEILCCEVFSKGLQSVIELSRYEQIETACIWVTIIANNIW